MATLRHYEECGLFQPVARRGRVRQYDRAALERLAYAQPWHHDGLMPLADTAAVMTTAHAPERHALITTQHDAMQERIDRLTRAAAVLRHAAVPCRPPAQLSRHRCPHPRPRRCRPHRRGAPPSRPSPSARTAPERLTGWTGPGQGGTLVARSAPVPVRGSAGWPVPVVR
ncbi:helix-turn-helix domain-containing protein [Streptomyces sp. MJM1172]|uniref:helix-turn-helix domain-containing protein n=1 Tax=Streptomyces sp. MJM1172 TaxID=1703926 RepID=UPI003FD215A8